MSVHSQLEASFLTQKKNQALELENSTLRVLGSSHDLQLNKVATALRLEPSVADCVVLAVVTETSRLELVAYIVPTGSFEPARLTAHLQAILPDALLPEIYIPLSVLPLTPTGQVDKQALSQIEAIDSQLVQRWEEKLRELPEVEQVAVVIQEQVETLPPLHLSDLLPDWKAAAVSEVNQPIATPITRTGVPQQSETKRLAISHGEPLRLPEGSPTTLSQALQRAALESPNKGIVYIQSDGSEVVQFYPALLKEAQRILAGLRNLGLKPQDKVIFQFDQNQDFIAAFWGCILGGFIPVPIAIAPSYCESNSTINKLHHAWQILERPIVLTSQKLAAAICSLSSFLGLEEFRVETVEALRSSEPESNWHTSRPEDLALIMLTSGSTGMPKGVMLSEHNLLNRSLGSVQMNGFTNQEITLNWMSLDHVAGLIYFHIRDVYLCCQQIHAATEVVLKEPLKWLDLIERFRVTVTFAPNFAYGLVNDQAEMISKRQWDLSSIQFFLNGAEAIHAKTSRRFLQLLAPHKLSTTVMHPAWGMAETSSGITYSNNFSLDSTTDDDLFVEVGEPIPGISLRIVDDNNQVVEEKRSGSLQVKGLSVTSGYYQNPELNQEVFTDDGWFNTGDLGFLHQGRLTLTGRSKDIIIINGLNYYSHEIEAVVEEVKGVEVSYTAACAVRILGSNSDLLAIFFHTSVSDSNRLTSLLKDIRASVVRKIGVNPTYLIPVEKKAIPKTEIGKIQRSQLSQRFIAGEFDSILKQLDIAAGNANTLPDWFYRPFWRPKVAASLATQPITGSYLVFLDRLKLGATLSLELSKLNCLCIEVEIGAEFNKFDANHYQINPNHAQHYKQLLASVLEDNISLDGILHLWTYEEYREETSSLEALEQSLHLGVYSLLFLTQALCQLKFAKRSIQLQVISSYSQPTSPADKIVCGKSPLIGLLETIQAEIPGLNCRHIDLPANLNAGNASYILQELGIAGGERQVAYRNRQRLIPRLEKVDLQQEKKQALPFKRGGMYLLTGGLGGIAVEIAKYLLAYYQVRLLLVGRTQLPPRSAWETRLKQGDAISERIKAFLSLEQLGGEIFYEAVDVCNEAQLQQVVERAKSHWQCELHGVIHAAGVLQERLIVEETQDSFAATLRPKVLGTWVLHQLLKNQPNSLFISFSSVNSFFGGTTVGAYAAANRFLDGFSHYLRSENSIQSYCFAWSMWDEVGISRGYSMKELSRTHGYYAITGKQGLNSFLAGLHHDQAHLLVGLDGSKNHIRRHIETTSCCRQKLRAYFTPATQSVPVTKLQSLEVRERFGAKSTCDFIELQEMPILPDGSVNRNALFELEGINIQRQQVPMQAQTEVEKTLASIWQELLRIDAADIHSNFFDLGGNSLLLAQLSRKLQSTFKKEVSLVELFQYSTISLLSQFLGKVSKEGVISQSHPSQIRGQSRREKVLNMKSKKISVKLEKMCKP